MTRLDQAEVCQDCGRPYLVANGHNCSGPRSSLYPLPEETR
jgi:hypothetical protein